ncbi:MAG: T9SS type A sorting domain-containing protein, partial [Ignavibacteria bacterium]
RYGHLTFTRSQTFCDSVSFTLTCAFRRDGYAPNNNVGSVLTETIGNTILFFGDGTQTPVLQFKVISIDVLNNYLICRALQPGSTTKETITHRYTAAGPSFLAQINSSARTLIEQNHPSGGYIVSALVYKGNCNNSPISSLPVILFLPRRPSITFTVPAFISDTTKTIRFRYATVAEMGVTGVNPPTAFGDASSIDPITGVVTWNTSTAILGGLYSCQIIIEERDIVTDTIKTRVAVDWLTQIQLDCPDVISPVFDSPPTPSCGFAFGPTVGENLTFTVQASDNLTGVTLNATGLPPGATMTPTLPITGNPVSSVFSWTPTSDDNQLVSFTAIDSCGNQTICVFTFDFLLPVELSSFVSTVYENEVTLQWQTATENNNQKFDIERANVINGNSSDWRNVGTVLGSGNSTTPKNYTFTDQGLNAGNFSYRLKQIDYNGEFKYFDLNSEIVIGTPIRFDMLQNYPNPFNPSTIIAYTLPVDGNVKLNVYDISGKLVMTVNDGFRSAGYYTTEFNSSNLSSGVYYYRIDFNGSGQNFQKVMKMVVLK